MVLACYDSDGHIQKIPRWFYNSGTRKGAPPPPISKPQGERKGKGLGALGAYERTPGARDIFGQERANEINEIAQARRNTAGEPSSLHLKYWNTVLGEKWEQLSAEEQNVYHIQSHVRKVASQKPLTQKLVYQ